MNCHGRIPAVLALVAGTECQAISDLLVAQGPRGNSVVYPEQRPRIKLGQRLLGRSEEVAGEQDNCAASEDEAQSDQDSSESIREHVRILTEFGLDGRAA